MPRRKKPLTKKQYKAVRALVRKAQRRNNRLWRRSRATARDRRESWSY